MTRLPILPAGILRCGHTLADLDHLGYCAVCKAERSTPKPAPALQSKTLPKPPSAKSLAWTPERREKQRQIALARWARERAEAKGDTA